MLFEKTLEPFSSGRKVVTNHVGPGDDPVLTRRLFHHAAMIPMREHEHGTDPKRTDGRSRR